MNPVTLQHRAASRSAHVRSARARFKNDLKQGEADICRVLMYPPEEAKGMSIEAVLFATPGLGRTRINLLLDAARLNPTRELGRLTPEQRAHLVLVLRRNSLAGGEA